MFNVLVSNYFPHGSLDNPLLCRDACDDQNISEPTEVALPLEENGHWQILDKSSAEQFHHTLKTGSLRPASVTITGSH